MFYKIYVGIYFLGKKVLEMQILQNVRNYCQTLIKWPKIVKICQKYVKLIKI